MRPRKACKYPNVRLFGWVSYDEVGVVYSGKLGSRSEARASDLRSYPGLWWKRIKLYLYEGTKVSTLRGHSQLADPQGALCVPTYNFTPLIKCQSDSVSIWCPTELLLLLYIYFGRGSSRLSLSNAVLRVTYKITINNNILYPYSSRY